MERKQLVSSCDVMLLPADTLHFFPENSLPQNIFWYFIHKLPLPIWPFYVHIKVKGKLDLKQSCFFFFFVSVCIYRDVTITCFNLLFLILFLRLPIKLVSVFKVSTAFCFLFFVKRVSHPLSLVYDSSPEGVLQFALFQPGHVESLPLYM